MDNIIIREMVDDERRFVWELGKSSFGLVESLAFRKPKKAFIASGFYLWSTSAQKSNS
ncbi:TPA: hypothetical protein UL416_003273 [Clostridioides difficile]|nr:hypothetical protein [Clostridioides difficile]HBH3031032.1 hypothetical protein [Clostridioides difficile]HEL2873168.1 hypothetical protein [Clostridioides difficile]